MVDIKDIKIQYNGEHAAQIIYCGHWVKLSHFSLARRIVPELFNIETHSEAYDNDLNLKLRLILSKLEQLAIERKEAKVTDALETEAARNLTNAPQTDFYQNAVFTSVLSSTDTLEQKASKIIIAIPISEFVDFFGAPSSCDGIDQFSVIVYGGSTIVTTPILTPNQYCRECLINNVFLNFRQVFAKTYACEIIPSFLNLLSFFENAGHDFVVCDQDGLRFEPFMSFLNCGECGR